MSDFTTGMTGVAVADDGIVLAYDKAFLLAATETNTIDQFVTYREDIGAKSITITKYSQLNAATTALTDKEDPDSTALADSAIVLTPAEYGNVVTTTRLANLQNAGKVDVAAAQLVGINAGKTHNRLAILAAEASTNATTVTGGAENELVAGNVMTAAYLNTLYNKLARASVPGLAGDMYVAVMHDDVIHDLRNATAAGSWQDVSKYTSSESVFRNEVGALGGFRIIRNNDITINTDAGASAVDTYHTICLGKNGLGKAVSQPTGMRVTGPFDKLARFVNFGWYGVFAYGIVDTDAVWIGTTASSVGVNA